MSHLPIEKQIVFLYTHDLAVTAQFYEEVLGLPLARDQGDCRIYRVTEDGHLAFCQRDEAPDVPVGVIFTIITPDVDIWYETLRAKGVNFEQPPVENPKYHIYHCFLRDPNGYLIEVQRFLD